MGSPTVDKPAQAAEQQNQVQGQQYAQQQQQAALTGLKNWNTANPAPVNTAKPLQMPGAASPTTMGGGQIQAGQGARPGAGTPPQPGAQQMQHAAGAMGSPTLSPQMKQQILAALQGQAAPRAM